MNFPTFWDFLMEGGYDLLFENEETGEKQFKCPSCGRFLTKHDKIEYISESEKLFKCPYCDEPMEVK